MFTKGQAHSQAVFDTYAWNEIPEGFGGTRLSVPSALLPVDDLLAALLDAPTPVDPPMHVNTLNGMNVQTSQAQILNPGDVDLAYGRRHTNVEPIPALCFLGETTNATSSSSSSSGIAGGPIIFLDPTMNFDPRGTWADPLFHHDSTGAPGEWTNTAGGPARDVMGINTLSQRLRGTRLPPQIYEEDVVKLYHRLIYGGANFRAAVIARDVIFAAEVTVDALMAPIQMREMSVAYGGAKRMWQMLLETKEVMPGKTKYFCLLCPVGGCRGYAYDRDAVRHFNRDHFGFSFPCEHW